MEIVGAPLTICEELEKLFSPAKIIVFGIKHNECSGEISDFDVCMVLDGADQQEKDAAVRRAYLDIDSDIPFDVFVYSTEEWESFLLDEGSFASRIARKGLVYNGTAR